MVTAVRLVVIVGVLLAALTASAVARADGGVFPRAQQVQQAAAGPVRTPDQRALLRYDAAAHVETLVIETTVKGDGTEFAWVLPLPAVPKIEASTTGVFPTLRVLSPVDVWTDMTPWWLVVLVVGSVYAWRRDIPIGVLVGGTLVAVILVGALVPQVQGDALSFSKYIDYGGALPDATPTTVRVLSRESIGAFDTTVLTAKDATDLRRWFDENGYAGPPEIDAVLDAYLRDGWVFVASKVRADSSATGVRNIHPLAFTFPATEAVYPMRLTGAVNDTLDLELYVFADRKAHATGLDATHCVAFGPWGDEAPVTSWTWHAEIARRAGDAKGVTRLVGTLDADAMRRDVTFDWDDLEDDRPLLFTPASAATIAGTAAALVLVVGLFVARAKTRRPATATSPATRGSRRLELAFLAATAVTGAVVWCALPTTEVPVDGRQQDSLVDWIGGRNHALHEGAVSAAVAEIEAAPGFRDAAEARAWIAPIVARIVNPFTGAPVREEDSPGNYAIEEREGRVFLTPIARWGSGRPYELGASGRTR